ncbi:hypothetical protein J6590_105399, partial [Homalodisca vitripennis]
MPHHSVKEANQFRAKEFAGVHEVPLVLRTRPGPLKLCRCPSVCAITLNRNVLETPNLVHMFLLVKGISL